jgi:hypothetical protein
MAGIGLRAARRIWGARYRCGGSVGFSPTSQLASSAGTKKDLSSYSLNKFR